MGKRLISQIFPLLLLSFLISEAVQAKELYWEAHGIVLSRLNDEQLQVLEMTINQLTALEPGKLQIDPQVYRRLSRFKQLFGIPFRGKALSEWLLSRIRKVAYHNGSTAALNQNKGTFFLGDLFFKKINTAERLYLLIHEARHSDGDGYDHVRCPEGFRFISATQPDLDLEREPGCDNGREGAYAFQAAFLFELFAYGIFDQKEAGLLYNSSVSRILP